MNYYQQTSKRLTYRKATAQDIVSWSAFFENNDMIHFLGIDTRLTPLEAATNWIKKQQSRYANKEYGHLAVIHQAEQTLIGMGGILLRNLKGQQEYEIAYSLKPAYWGKGYGTEIAMQMKKYGTHSQLSKRFVSIIHKENIPSIKVAEKNGMQPLYETQYLGMDVYVYGINIKNDAQ